MSAPNRFAFSVAHLKQFMVLFCLSLVSILGIRHMICPTPASNSLPCNAWAAPNCAASSSRRVIIPSPPSRGARPTTIHIRLAGGFGRIQGIFNTIERPKPSAVFISSFRMKTLAIIAKRTGCPMHFCILGNLIFIDPVKWHIGSDILLLG